MALWQRCSCCRLPPTAAAAWATWGVGGAGRLCLLLLGDALRLCNVMQVPPQLLMCVTCWLWLLLLSSVLWLCYVAQMPLQLLVCIIPWLLLRFMLLVSAALRLRDVLQMLPQFLVWQGRGAHASRCPHDCSCTAGCTARVGSAQREATWWRAASHCCALLLRPTLPWALVQAVSCCWLRLLAAAVVA